MPYLYEIEKPSLFTEKGSESYIKGRDWVLKILKKAGAFNSGAYMAGPSSPGTSWGYLAELDRMLEVGDIAEVTGPGVAGQCRVFISSK